MRLTSYNMAVKILHAKGCLADMVDRMWAYMEEGDTENAQCVREKALGLYSLIETAGRWRPTIKDGYRTASNSSLYPVTYPSPFIVGETRLNAMQVASPFIAYGGLSSAVAEGSVHSFNRFISENDDLVQVSAIRTGAASLTITALTKAPFTSFSSTNSGGSTGSAIVTVIADDEEFSDAVPYCLTDAQVLSVIGKIDELCECKC